MNFEITPPDYEPKLEFEFSSNDSSSDYISDHGEQGVPQQSSLLLVNQGIFASNTQRTKRSDTDDKNSDQATKRRRLGH